MFCHRYAESSQSLLNELAGQRRNERHQPVRCISNNNPAVSSSLHTFSPSCNHPHLISNMKPLTIRMYTLMLPPMNHQHHFVSTSSIIPPILLPSTPSLSPILIPIPISHPPSPSPSSYQKQKKNPNIPNPLPLGSQNIRRRPIIIIRHPNSHEIRNTHASKGTLFSVSRVAVRNVGGDGRDT